MPDRHVVLLTPLGDVHAVITDEILAVAKRVREAMEAGLDPDPRDMAGLMAWASDGPHHG